MFLEFVQPENAHYVCWKNWKGAFSSMDYLYRKFDKEKVIIVS